MDITVASTHKTAKVNYPNLDLMKFFLALLVVEIHTRPLKCFYFAETLIEGIDVLAVPLFFLASGFLCFRDLNYASFGVVISAGTERVRNTIIKLLRLYLIWTLLYLPLTIFGNVLLGKNLLHGSLSFIRGTLFVGENYYSWPLWYLLASIVGFTLVFICLHRGGWRFKHIIPFSLILLLLGYGITYVQGWDGAPVYLAVPIRIYCRVFGSSRNGLFEGFFYIAVGAALGLKWDQLNRVPLLLEFAAVAFGLAGTYLVSNDAHLPFCAIASIGLFLLSVRRYGVNLNSCALARRMSTIIYLVHMYFVVVFVYGICGQSNPDLHASNVNRPLLFLFTLSGSIIVSTLVIGVSKRMPIIKAAFGI